MPNQRLRHRNSHTHLTRGVLLFDLDRRRSLDLAAEALAIATSPGFHCQLLCSRWNHQLIHAAHASLSSTETRRSKTLQACSLPVS